MEGDQGMAIRRKRGSRRKTRRSSRSSYSMQGRYRRRSRRRTTARVVKAEACACPGALSAGDKWALAQLDPFNPKAYGGKIPDSDTVPSCTVALNDLVSLGLTTPTNVS